MCECEICKTQKETHLPFLFVSRYLIKIVLSRAKHKNELMVTSFASTLNAHVVIELECRTKRNDQRATALNMCMCVWADGMCVFIPHTKKIYVYMHAIILEYKIQTMRCMCVCVCAMRCDVIAQVCCTHMNVSPSPFLSVALSVFLSFVVFGYDHTHTPVS